MRLGRLSVCLCAAVAASADVTVRVKDPSGAVVPRATVVFRGDSGEVAARAVASPEGVATFHGSAVSAEVRAAGFLPGRAALGDRSEVTVTLRLAPVENVMVVEGQIRALSPVASAPVGSDRLAKPDLVESLRAAPNVHVMRRGGTNFDPVVQGLREYQLAMVVDGTRTFAAGLARMDSELSHVDPGSVASVQVVTGPYALTEGSGALAAILVDSVGLPTRPRRFVGGSGGLAWRSNGSGRMGHARLHGVGSAFGFGLHASGDLLDDYEAGRSGRPASTLVPGDASSHQVGARTRFNPTPDQEILASGLYDEQTSIDFPGRLLTAEHFLLRSFRASYRWAWPDGAVRSVRLTAYSNRKSHRMSNRGKPTSRPMPGRMPPFALDVSLPAESDTVGSTGRVELSPAESWELQVGFDWFRLEQDAQRFIARARDRKLLFSDAVWAGTSLADLGIYFHAGRSFDRGEIRAVARMDFVASDAGRPSAFFLASGGKATERSEANATFSVAGRYDLGSGLTLSAGAGRVVRTASALERYSDRFPSTRFQVAAEFVGSPGLRPESSLQGDVSLAWNDSGFRLHGGAFVRSLGSYISARPDPSLEKRLPLSPPTVFRYVNGGSAFFRGWNLGVRRPVGRFEFRFGASKTLADDRELLQPILGIPPMEVDSAARFYSLGRRFWAEYGLRSAWDQRRVAFGRLETPSPGFTLHALRIGADLWDGATLHVGLENLGDKYYYEHLNSLNPFTRQRVPETGRALTAAFVTAW